MKTGRHADCRIQIRIFGRSSILGLVRGRFPGPRHVGSRKSQEMQNRAFQFSKTGDVPNNFRLPAFVIAQLYKHRWQIELFFKWIKQHLRIKAFYGTSENAVKTQIWIAVAVYVLVAIVKKRLQLEQSLYTILQILSVTCFEKTSIYQILTESAREPSNDDSGNQLQLFNF